MTLTLLLRTRPNVAVTEMAGLADTPLVCWTGSTAYSGKVIVSTLCRLCEYRRFGDRESA
jgi:hypothetical protein